MLFFLLLLFFLASANNCSSSKPECTRGKFIIYGFTAKQYCESEGSDLAKGIAKGTPAAVTEAFDKYCKSQCVKAIRKIIENDYLCCVPDAAASFKHSLEACEIDPLTKLYKGMYAITVGSAAACSLLNYNDTGSFIAASQSTCPEAAGCKIITQSGPPPLPTTSTCAYSSSKENLDLVCTPSGLVYQMYPSGGMFASAFSALAGTYLTYCNKIDGSYCALELGDTAYTAPLLLSQGQLTALCNNPTKLGCYRARWTAIAEGTRLASMGSVTTKDGLKPENMLNSSSELVGAVKGLGYAEVLEDALENMCRGPASNQYCLSTALIYTSFGICMSRMPLSSPPTTSELQTACATCNGAVGAQLVTVAANVAKTCCATMPEGIYKALTPPDPTPFAGSTTLQVLSVAKTYAFQSLSVHGGLEAFYTILKQAMASDAQRPKLVTLLSACNNVIPSKANCSEGLKGKASLSLDLAVSYAAVEAVTGLKVQLGHALAVDVAVLVGSTSRAVTVALAADAEHQVYIGGGLTSGIKAIITVSCEDDAAAARIQQRFATRMNSNSSFFPTVALLLNANAPRAFHGYTPIFWTRLALGKTDVGTSGAQKNTTLRTNETVVSDIYPVSAMVSIIALFMLLV